MFNFPWMITGRNFTFLAKENKKKWDIWRQPVFTEWKRKHIKYPKYCCNPSNFYIIQQQKPSRWFSHLIYRIRIWSAATHSVTNIIATKQNMAIRILTNAKDNAHTEPIFKSNKILPLYDLIKFFKMLFMYAFINDKLPISFANT